MSFQCSDLPQAIGCGRPPMPDFWTPSKAGAAVLHEPKMWPEYHPGPEHHPGYYGAFVRDPEGNNVEAVCPTAGA